MSEGIDLLPMKAFALSVLNNISCATASALLALFAPSALMAEESSAYTNQLIVSYEAPNQSTQRQLDSVALQLFAEKIGRPLTSVRLFQDNAEIFQLPCQLNLEEIMSLAEQLSHQPGIARVEPNLRVYHAAAPNDSPRANLDCPPAAPHFKPIAD
jgi:hypothetical protein